MIRPDGEPGPAVGLGDRAAGAVRRLAEARWARLAVFAAAVIGALFGIGLMWQQVVDDPLADVRAYYGAATRLNDGLPLYPADQDVNSSSAYFYPPLFAILFRPLALLPYDLAAAIWAILMAASFAATLWLLGLRRPSTWLAVGILGMPIMFVLAVAQAHALVTLLLATVTPAGVALAAQVKLFPILAAAYWVGRRDWRALAHVGGWSVGLILVQIVLEPQACLDYLGTIGLGWVGNLRNFSPYVISPVAWVVFVAVLAFAAVRWARTGAGWPLAVALATLAPPRLLLYMPMELLAALRRTPGALLEGCSRGVRTG